MRFIIKISSVFLIYNVFLSAQIMVISQNKVVFSKMKEYQDLMEKHWNPVFDKLVDEGKLNEVGSLSHSWGDEWNIVGYYKAKDLASFEKAWSEGYKKFADNAEYIYRDLFNFPKEMFANKKMLDFGGGSGEQTVYITNWGAQITHVEMNSMAIDIAKKVFKKYIQRNF